MTADRNLPRLAIFVRAPNFGKVKTRLAAAVGDRVALRAYEELLALTLLRLAPGRGRFAPEIWVDGDATAALPRWRDAFPVVAQPCGDLGERMGAAFDDGVSALVGSDIPVITAEYVDRALAALGDADVVLGPTEDGGYCLVAMNAPRPEIFEGIPWGSPEVLAATKRAAQGLSVRLLEALWDVDDAADLARWRNGSA